MAAEEPVKAEGTEAEASAARSPILKALMRKVAQLAQIAVHLNARNDDAELQCERLCPESEDNITVLLREAALKVAGHRAERQAHLDPEKLRKDLNVLSEAWESQRHQALDELCKLQRQGAEHEAAVLQCAQASIQAEGAELWRLAARLRASMEAFQHLVRSEVGNQLEQEATQGNPNEVLDTLRADHQRRVMELCAAHEQEVEQQQRSLEAASAHLRRLHQAELETLRIQAEQKRREQAHRLEDVFYEERQTREQLLAHMETDLEQLHHDICRTEDALPGLARQVDAMRATLEEMCHRAGQAEDDVAREQEAAATEEAEVATLQRELAVLQVRRRAAGLPTPLLPVPSSRTTGPGTTFQLDNPTASLSESLRESILGAERLEAELYDASSLLADLDDDLAEREKQLEILEVDLQEERLRIHQLEAHILKCKEALRL